MEIVNTHELQNGDIVESHNATFRLHSRKVWTRPDDTKYDPKGTVTFQTELLEYRPGNMPRRWAETWTIQGNSGAKWRRVTEG